MNITYMEFSQASIEIVCGIICVMLSIIVHLNRNEKNSMKMFVWMFLIAAALFINEAGAYIFRGNTDAFSIAMTRITNFGVFLMNMVLALVCVNYMYYLMYDKNIVVGNSYRRVSEIFFGIGIVILLVNIFTGWMYYFDDQNYYHRNILWFPYTGSCIMTFMMGSVLCIKQRKNISRTTLVSNVVYLTVPFVAVLIQTIIYDVAFTNIGIAICLFSMMIGYLMEREKNEDDDFDAIQAKRRFLEVVILFAIMVVSMSASIITSIISVNRLAAEHSVDESKIMTEMVSNSLEKEVIKPITASVTMSKDINLRDYLKKSGDNPEAYAAEFSNYLDAVKKGLGYKTAFSVCDKTQIYYTHNGLSKYLDCINDEHDKWYTDFLKQDVLYSLNVDTDEENDKTLSVFVNVLVQEEDGNILGACGFGVEIESLIEAMKKYEEKYNLKIDFVNADGLIQVDTDRDRIERDVIEIDNKLAVAFEKLTVESTGKCNKAIRYLPEIGWYLVLEDYRPNSVSGMATLVPSIITFLIGIIIMGSMLIAVRKREQKAATALAERRRVSLTDELTGLYNRRAYEETVELLGRDDRFRDYCFIMLDVNGLKTVNDNLGHIAGDELIIGSANCMETTFDAHGRIYRIGGDEFVAILKCSEDKLEESIKTFDHVISNWKGELVKELTISKGYVVAAKHPELTLREIMELADKLMYADKDAYYARTGKNRRK